MEMIDYYSNLADSTENYPSAWTLHIENAVPVSVTLKATAFSPLPHTTFVTLLRDIDRIKIRNDITLNFNGIYTWGFGFDIDNPDLWHEELGGVIRAKLLGDGGIIPRAPATTG